MIFDYFKSKNSTKGQVCTLELFKQVTNSDTVVDLCKQIALEKMYGRPYDELKGQLPAITPMGTFDGKGHSKKNARPSGLYMLDIDHVKDPEAVWKHIIEKHSVEELQAVLAHKTPSTEGLRIICRGRKEFTTIAENIEWFKRLYPEIKFDKVCTDISRCSFLVAGSYIYYLDESMFNADEPCFIKGEGEGQTQTSPDPSQGGELNALGQDLGTYNIYGFPFFNVQKNSDLFDKPELFGTEDFVQDNRDLRRIAVEWINQRGGVPAIGKRNQTLYELNLDMRKICGYDEALMLACTPALLERAEVLKAIRSAKGKDKTKMTKEFKQLINSTPLFNDNEDENEDEETIYNYLTNGDKLLSAGSLPPVFKEFASIVPPDFRRACVVALLPMLGPLGSRLRARYLDGVVQTPSFQCEIEAPMASGKSFVSRIYDYVMKDVIEQDEENRAKEEAYDEKMRRAKNAKEQPEPESYMVRLLGAKVSISKLMDRLAAAHGLHVFTYTDEVANVIDGIAAGKYGDIRALLRNAFDNQRYSQEYKSENSSKKQCRIFYNTLHCGTPAEYKKLYKNVEDGTVTRITFATLPDQAFKKMPKFKELTTQQKRIVDTALKRISGVSCVKGKVMPEHEMEGLMSADPKANFLNSWVDEWLERMRRLSERFDNRSLDTFRRRSAVVGFRAGMVAYYLYGKHDKATKAKTVAFAELIAEQMVVSLMRRYNVSEVSNIILYQNVWNRLGDSFTAGDVEAVASQCGVDSPARNIVYRWKSKGLIEKDVKTNMYTKRKIG